MHTSQRARLDTSFCSQQAWQTSLFKTLHSLHKPAYHVVTCIISGAVIIRSPAPSAHTTALMYLLSKVCTLYCHDNSDSHLHANTQHLCATWVRANISQHSPRALHCTHQQTQPAGLPSCIQHETAGLQVAILPPLSTTYHKALPSIHAQPPPTHP